MINNKELYCLYRARELKESLGMTLCQGWDQAEREWHRGEFVPHNIDRREDEYDDDMEYDE